MWETWVQSLDREDPLEKGTAIYSSILAWRIPGLQRIEHDSATFTFYVSICIYTDKVVQPSLLS